MMNSESTEKVPRTEKVQWIEKVQLQAEVQWILNRKKVKEVILF